jgi:hypothetical protein
MDVSFLNKLGWKAETETEIEKGIGLAYSWEAYACALVLSGRRSKKPIHDGSQKNELNGYKKIIDASLYIAECYTLYFFLI